MNRWPISLLSPSRRRATAGGKIRPQQLLLIFLVPQPLTSSASSWGWPCDVLLAVHDCTAGCHGRWLNVTCCMQSAG